MGQDLPKAYEISLETLPETILKYPEQMKNLGIEHQGRERPREDHEEPRPVNAGKPLAVSFPDGWTHELKSENGSSMEVHNFFQPDGTLALTITADLTAYDVFARFHFWTKVELEARADELRAKEQKRKNVELFIAQNFSGDWSADSTHLVYFFETGVSGDTQDKRERDRDHDTIMKFSHHEFIGYCADDKSDELVQTLERVIAENDFDHIGQVTHKNLVRGPSELHRHERAHLFKE